MRLRFNGTAIYIYGARRGNHGLYSGTYRPNIPYGLLMAIVKMDNGNPVYQLGYSKFEDIQQLLFYQAGLDANSEHTIVSVCRSATLGNADKRARSSRIYRQ